MKNILLLLVCCMVTSCIHSQNMQVKQFNFSSFNTDQKQATGQLDKRASTTAKVHPEYGILPYNAQCKECMELPDQRTLTSRSFIDPKNPKHTYSQQSYLPLHYQRSADDVWRTIDRRLRPDATQPGVYTAVNQPVTTKCDLNKMTTSLNTGEVEFEFNKNLSLYFFDENRAYSASQPGNYSNRTIGEEGLEVTNIWPGINMQQIFRAGEIETQYVIYSPLQLPIDTGWMVIEDHFTLPDGFTVEEKPNGEHPGNGYYKGDYVIKNAKSETLVTYQRPVYIDAMAYGMHGNYKLLKTGNDYTLQMFVPVSWLNKESNIYPIYIDPIVSGETKLGNFLHVSGTGLSANMGFTDMHLGSCDYHMKVRVPGSSQLTTAMVDLEYDLTYDNTCGSPPEPAPYCTFSQVTMEVVCDSCGTTTGLVSCNPASPPYIGTCTTDPLLVPGAHALQYAASSLLPCFSAQNPDYLISFTLKNRDSICGDMCGYLCARGNMWAMTVEANEITDTAPVVTITADKNAVCPGQPVTFTVHPVGGVPPFHYVWVSGSGTDTVFGRTTYTISPEKSDTVFCFAYDTTGQYVSISDTLTVLVSGMFTNTLPNINLCSGGTATLNGASVISGGSPLWTGSDSAAQSWLSDTAASSPQIHVPAGTTRTFYYVLTVAGSSCQVIDTVYVFSHDTVPTPFVSVSGNTLFSSAVSSSQWYLNDTAINGATLPYYVYYRGGNYSVRTTGAYGCTSALSDPVTVNDYCYVSFFIVRDQLDTNVYFVYLSSAGYDLSYLWSFGDNSTSNEEYASHIYAQAGYYNICVTVTSPDSCTSTFCADSFDLRSVQSLIRQIVVVPPTGINNLTKDASVTIYPNPASTELVISASNFQPQLISVYDLNGRKITEQKFVQKLDISALSVGAYFMEVKGQGVSVQRKFVKMRE